MASDFLRKKAREQAEKLEKEHGASAYGSATWLDEQINGGTKWTDLQKKDTAKEIAPLMPNYKVGNKDKDSDDGSPERTWFKASKLWDDGYQFGDVTKTILASGKDLAEDVTTGFLGIGEMAVDAFATVAPYIAQGQYYANGGGYIVDRNVTGAFNQQIDSAKKLSEDFVKKDLYDEEAVAKKLLSLSATQRALNAMGVDTEKTSIFGEKTDALAQSGGQLLGQLGVNAIAPGSGMALMGVTSFGSEAEDALGNGATLDEAAFSGVISAGAELLTEKIGGISFGGQTLTDRAFKNLSRRMTGTLADILIASGKITAGALAEGGEEILSGYMSALGQKMSYMKDKDVAELFTKEDALESFIGGVVLGGMGEVGEAVGTTVQGKDYVSGLTDNEKAVVDKIYKDEVAEAEKTGKVSEKEKDKIYDKVLKDMENGDISTETIEEVLGGDTYADYKKTVEGEESALKELSELYEGDELQQQVTDFVNNSQRLSKQEQLSKEVSELVKGDRLLESYRQKEYRGQKFDADLSQYDAKQQETVKKAIESGVLNNTRRTHELVDIIAKISADKGVVFDFTNNEKLKNSGFAVDGKTVNGYVVDDVITLNSQSSKYLNSVVGHEITHVLEGTEVYDALQQMLFDYAKSRKSSDGKFDSEYKERLYNTRLLYKNVEGYKGLDGFNKIKKEVVADLVGDYLFTDSDFVRKLSTEHRNIFQKIYDEIKYLCKVATAGSKEARELEKVKKAFEDAYRGDSKATGETKYSLTDKTKPTYEELVAKNPVQIVNVKGGIESGSYADMKTAAMNKATSEGWFDVPHHNTDTDSLIFLTEKSFTHAYSNLRSGFGEDTIRCMAHIPEIIQNAVLVSVDAPRNPTKQETKVYTFFGAIDGVGGIEPVKLTVKEYDFSSLDAVPKNIRSYFEKNGVMESYDSLYDAHALEVIGIEGVKKESDASGKVYEQGSEARATSDSKLSIADLLNLVKGDATKYIPEKQYSLSNIGEQPRKYGNYHVSGDEVSYQEVAPVSKTIEITDETLSDDNAQTDTVENPAISDTDSTMDDIAPVKTTKEKLNERLNNRQTELEHLQRLRAETSSYYDEKIAKEQELLDAKKNKQTKVANRLKMRIERLQRLKADNDAKYAKRIQDITKSIDKTSVELEKDHTEKDRYANAKARIERILESDKAALAEEYAVKKAELERKVSDKNAYISNMARELYDELRGLRKGVRASENLGSLLDAGYDWNNLRSALSNVRYNPSERVNMNSSEESAVRQLIEESYENDVYSIDDMELELSEKIHELENEADTKKSNARRATQRNIKQGEYAKQMEELIGDTTNWVDKKFGIQYEVNTLRRNLRDIVRDSNGNRDIAKADAIYDELQGKYNANEALLNRESNQIKKPYADMKLTNAEDAYIQMLGEFRHNPSTTITQEMVDEYYQNNKGKIDTAKVDKAIEMARKTYDTLLERVNEVLREQGMKEIPYRKGYFPHFTDDKQSFIGKLFNWKVKNNEIPTDIAGLTEQFNPNRSWQSFNKQRKSDTTDYSFSKGLDTYLQGALDWIYHIEDIQKRRAFENHIRYVHSEKGVQEKIDAIRANQEYDADEMQEQIDLVLKEAGNPLNNFVTDFRTGTNTLAGKKSSMDRGLEQKTNRKFYSVMTNVSNRVSANMVAGSVSSALTNFIPIIQSWGEVSPVSSLRAMADTIRSTFRDDGTIDKSDFLTNRLKKSENLYKTWWDNVGEKVSFLMESVDSFAAQTVWRSKYLENISNGMSESEAIKNADRFAESVIAGRSRGNMPTIFDSKSPVAKLFTAFQLEVNNQYGYMFKDMPQDMKNEYALKLAKGYATMFMGAYAYNALYSSLVGRDAAFDPIGIIEDLLRDMGLFGDDEEEEPVDTAMNFAENVLQEVPFVGGLLGGGRVPISAAMPYSGEYEGLEAFLNDISNKDFKSIGKELLNPVYYLAMPLGGGQLKKTIEGLSMFSDEHPISGSYTDSGKLRFPVEDTFGNRLQAGIFGQYSSKNARDYFDNGRSALSENQIEEFMSSGMNIQDYWDYREGLKDLSGLGEKADYIDSLDLTNEQKNLLINNISGRNEAIDMSDYGDYDDFEEFDFATKNPEKFTLSKAVAGDVVTYRKYTGDLYDIKADKDSSGKSIAGSRKEKVIDYINNLDLDYGQKIILFKSEYNADNTYNYDILDYLNGREDLTFDDRVTILKELGFNVDSKGNVTW